MRTWSRTDVGKQRKQNQDAFRVRRLMLEDGTGLLAAVVCDGMGGAKAGNVASAMAAEVFMRELTANCTAVSSRAEVLENAVLLANAEVYDRSRQDEDCSGMGTTLVAVITDGQQAHIVNVGDSRCYLVRSGAITQITRDHSVVQDMVDRGEIDSADAWKHPNRNYITRALGVELFVRCDSFTLPQKPGDVLLLCSDGLSGVVNAQELLFEIVYGGESETAVDRMVDIALQRGAPDNVTAVMLVNPKAEQN